MAGEPWANDPIVEEPATSGSATDQAPWENDPVVAKQPAESPLATGAREAIEGAATLPGMIAGAEAGAAVGTAVGGPIGTFVGGLGGGIIGGVIANRAKDKLLEATGVREGEGFFSKQAKEAGLKENPESGFAGELVGTAGLGFKAGIGTTPLVQRVLGGGLMGGFEAVNEGVSGEGLNPTHIAEAAGAGAVFATPRGWTQPFQQAGQKLGQTVGKLASRREPVTEGAGTVVPDAAGNPRGVDAEVPAGSPERPNAWVATNKDDNSTEPRTARGFAEEMAPPVSQAREQEDPLPTGNDSRFGATIQGVGSERDGRKPALQPTTGEGNGLSIGLIDPTVRDAILAQNRTAVPEPARAGSEPGPTLADIARGRPDNQAQPRVPATVPEEVTGSIPRPPTAVEPPAPVARPPEAAPRVPETRPENVPPGGGNRPDVPQPRPPAEPAAPVRLGPESGTRNVVSRVFDELKARASSGDVEKASQAVKIAERIAAIKDPVAQAAIANDVLRGLLSKRGQVSQTESTRVPSKAPESPTGKMMQTKSKAEQSTRALAAIQKAIDAHPPVEGETSAQMRDRYTRAVATARAANQGKLPIGTFKEGGYAPRQKPPEWRLMKHMIEGSQSTMQEYGKRVADLAANEKLLRDQIATKAQPEQEVSTARPKAGSEAAGQAQEVRRAQEAPMSEEDKMIEAIDRARQAEKEGRIGEEPAEDVTGTVKEVKNRDDLAEAENRQSHVNETATVEYGLQKNFDLEALKQTKAFKNREAAFNEANPVKVSRAQEASGLVARKAGEAPKEAEGAASEVRRPQLSAADKARYADLLQSTALKQPVGEPTHAPDIIADSTKQMLAMKRKGVGTGRAAKKIAAAQAAANPATPPPPPPNAPPQSHAAAAYTAFSARYPAVKTQIEKWLGIPQTDFGRITRWLLGEAMATRNLETARWVKELDNRWRQWNHVPEADAWSYLKALESHDTEDMIQQMTAAGTSQQHAETMAKNDFVNHLMGIVGQDPTKAAWAKWAGDEMLTHRKLMKDLFDWDQKYGSKADYVKNYVAHIFKDAGKAAAYINDKIQTLGPNWYQKTRMFELLADAKKHGYELRYTNPIDIVMARFQASANANMMVGALRRMEEWGLAVPMHKAEYWQKKNWGDINFYAGDRQHWLVRPEATQLFQNAFTRAGLNESNAVGSAYRAWMGLKNLWMPIQLGLSGFHAMHLMAGIIPAQTLSRAIQLSLKDGNWLQNLKDAGKLTLDQSLFAWPIDRIGMGIGKAIDDAVGGRFSKHLGAQAMEWGKMNEAQLRAAGPEAEFAVQMAREGGYSFYRPIQDIAGIERQYERAKAANNWKQYPLWLAQGLEKIQKPMFNYWIPSLKNELYLRGVQALSKLEPGKFSDPAQRGLMLHQLKNNIDDRFGEMFYDSKFWNPYVKHVAQGTMVSVGWNVGQLNQAGGAIRNLGRAATGTGTPLQKSLLKVDDKAKFVATYVGLSMGLAGMMTYALTGGSVPSSIMDYVYPRTGLTNPDGTPARLNTPSNIREVPTFIGHMQESGSMINAAAHVLYNKTVVQPFFEWATNKDFFGRQLSDVNAPFLTRMAQQADSLLGQHVSPISFTGAARAGEVPKSGFREKALAVAGYGPGPGYANHSAMENRILGLSRERRGPQPYEYGEKTGLGTGLVQSAIRKVAGDQTKSEARREGVRDLAAARQEGADTGAAFQKLAGAGQMGKQALRRTNPEMQVERAFANLPIEDQRSLVRGMSGSEFARFVLKNPEKFATGNAKRLLVQQRTGG